MNFISGTFSVTLTSHYESWYWEIFLKKHLCPRMLYLFPGKPKKVIIADLPSISFKVENIKNTAWHFLLLFPKYCCACGGFQIHNVLQTLLDFLFTLKCGRFGENGTLAITTTSYTNKRHKNLLRMYGIRPCSKCIVQYAYYALY